jgi:hypothetical protein
VGGVSVEPADGECYSGSHLETEQSHLLGGKVVLDENGFSLMIGPTGCTVSL